MSPIVSVIIPAYNTAFYITRAIESALGQTLENIEVIVVDDASTDNTLEVVKKFSDPRLKIIANHQNLGAGGARNRALQAAQGEWIAVLDSDDWYALDRLEKLLAVASTQTADMVADDLFLIQDGENLPWSTLIKESGETINEIKEINPVYFVETDVCGKVGLHLGISKPLFRRDFLVRHGIEYDADIKVTQDFWLSLTCLIKGARFFLVPEPYYFYLSRQGSLVYSRQTNRLIQDCEASEDFLKREECIANPQLIDALSRNLRVLKRTLSYYRVTESLKQRKWSVSLIEILRNPYFFVELFTRLPQILARRIDYYLFKNKGAFDIFYRSASRKRANV